MMSRLGNLGGALYRGEVSFNFVGRKRTWFSISAAVIVVGLVAILTLGLHTSIEFKGGTVFQFPDTAGSTSVQVQTALDNAGVVHEQPIIQDTSVGWRVQTEHLASGDVYTVQKSLADKFHLKSPNDVSPESVGASWGQQITHKALEGVIIFLVAVIIYLSLAFDWRMAAAALVALVHDMVITLGIYALLRFQVSPATVVGLLTILGYSLYDTVVVFDKVRENTRSLLTTDRNMTYSQAANLAVDQSLVRSINTSVIALLPVAGMLFIGLAVLGPGELQDLALVLFVGLLSGTYSSLCIATPVLTILKEHQKQYKDLAARLAARAASSKRKARQGVKAGAKTSAAKATVQDIPSDDVPDEDADDDIADDDTVVDDTVVDEPGTRVTVVRGSRQQPRRGPKGRPSGKRKR
jgi:preprotein translocase subunit SecF